MTDFEGVDPEWLRAIYQAQLQKFLHDNDRIWSSGSLLVPLSLAPFLALTRIDHLEDTHFVFFGFASSILMALWLVIGERHRQLQERSVRRLEEIEEHVVGWKPSSRKVLFRAQWARRVLTLAVPALWIAAALWWPR
jgi:hypothetical protein